MFKYRIKRDKLQPIHIAKPQEFKTDEQLTGFVQGWDASDIEERFARALNRYAKSIPIDYEFRTTIFGSRNEVGFKELDYRVQTVTGNYVFQIDGEFAHKSAATKAEDTVTDQRINELLKNEGYFPVKRIPGDKLATQEQADALVKDLII